MHVITGLGNIPPVRRWETARMFGPSGVVPLRAVVDDAERRAAQRFFPTQFVIGGRDTGSAVSAMQGGSLNGFWDDAKAWASGVTDFVTSSAKDTAFEVCEEVRITKASIQRHLATQANSEGMRTTAQVLLNQTVTDCAQTLPALKQLFDALLAESRALRGQAPLPVLTQPAAAETLDDPTLPPGQKSFFDNFYADGKLTTLGITAVVGGGLLVLAATTGALGRALR